MFFPEYSAMFLNVPQLQTKGREGLIMAEYTIRDLMAISKTTDRAIRQLFDDKKGNKELIQLKRNHIIKRQNRVYYDEVIYNWFVEYYRDKNSPLVESGVPDGKNISATEENPNITPAPTAPIEASAGPENEAIEELRANIAALEAKLEAKEGIIEGLRQANDSLKETNAALQGQFAELTDRIAAQEKDIESKTQQIERLIVSNNALSITVHRAQQERLLAEAKKPNLLQRIKNRLLGQKPVIVAEEPPEAVNIEPEEVKEEAEEQ